MRNETALREKAATGARFKEHQASFNECLDAVEQQYADELLSCFNPEGRERLWQAVQVVRKVREHFGSLVNDGTIAQHQLQELSRAR